MRLLTTKSAQDAAALPFVGECAVATRAAGASRFGRGVIEGEGPFAERNFILDQELVRRCVDVVAHDATPTPSAEEMQVVKVFIAVAKTGGRLRFLKLQQVAVVALPANGVIFLFTGGIERRGKGADQEVVFVRGVTFMAGSTSAIEGGMNYFPRLYDLADVPDGPLARLDFGAVAGEANLGFTSL